MRTISRHNNNEIPLISSSLPLFIPLPLLPPPLPSLLRASRTIPCKMIGREAPASARACARHQIVEIAASEVNTHVFDLVVALLWYC
jgi:hypothetical protein